MGSTALDWHQEIHWRRFDDTVRVEFVSSADMKRLIAFSEKPFASYRARIFCTREETNVDCVVDKVVGDSSGV